MFSGKRGREGEELHCRILEQIVCPITHSLPVCPVSGLAGVVYERRGIVEWLLREETSPVTRKEMRREELVHQRVVVNILDAMVKGGVHHPLLLSWKEEYETRVEEGGGEKRYFSEGKHVRTEFEEGHPFHGYIDFLCENRYVCTKFSKWHKKHGEICHFEEGRHVRTEFEEWHKMYGQICHFEEGRHVWTDGGGVE